MCTEDPWTLGGRIAVWKKIIQVVLKHPSFEGVDMAWKTLNDTVVQWIQNFGSDVYRKRFKIGTDDEQFAQHEQLMTEVSNNEARNPRSSSFRHRNIQRKNRRPDRACLPLMDTSDSSLERSLVSIYLCRDEALHGPLKNTRKKLETPAYSRPGFSLKLSCGLCLKIRRASFVVRRSSFVPAEAILPNREMSRELSAESYAR